MNIPRFMMRRRTEPEIRRGTLTTQPTQDLIGHRLLAITTNGLHVSFGDAAHIKTVTRRPASAVLVLSDGTYINAPLGARLTWQERK